MLWRQLADSFGGFDLAIAKFCDPPSHRAPYHFQENHSKRVTCENCTENKQTGDMKRIISINNLLLKVLHA